MNQVLEVLKNMKIKYELIFHPPIYTVKDAQKYFNKDKETHIKNLFLTDKNNSNFYLVILEANKRLDINKLSNLVGERLHFATEEELMKTMKLTRGSVSLFGLINNKEKDIKVYIDQNILKHQKVNFHPNDNTATIYISPDDMIKFLNNLKINYQTIDL